MKKIKQFITLILSVAMLLNSSILVFAEENNDNEIAILKQEIVEIQNYMDKQQIILELENQTQTYNVPLSSGKNATIKIRLSKKESPLRSTILTAKLGNWDIDYDAVIPGHSNGSVKLRGTFNVTHVPNMSSSTIDCPDFKVTGSSISAVPFQGASIIDKSSSYKTVQTNHEYKVTGYVSFSVSGKGTLNVYTEMLMYCKTTSGSERDKIYVDTKIFI